MTSHGHHACPVAHSAQSSSVAQGALPGETAEHESHAEVQGVGPGGGEGEGGCASEGGDGGGLGCGGGDGGGLGCGGDEGGEGGPRQSPSAAACVSQKRVASLSHLYHVPSLHGSVWPHLPVHWLNAPELVHNEDIAFGWYAWAVH